MIDGSNMKEEQNKYFEIMPNIRVTRPLGVKLLNKDVLLQDKRIPLGPEIGSRGFPNYPERPVFLFDKKLGRSVRDIEVFHSYWLVSDRMKSVLEGVDRNGCAFLECDIESRPMIEGRYWLCDVLRVLDAVDEEKSVIKIKVEPNGNKIYNFMGGGRLVFKQKIIQDVHIFRLKYLTAAVVCDELMKLSCRRAEIHGVAFRDLSNF